MDGCLSKILILFLFGISSALADKVNNEWMSTTRSLSMGNVGVGSAEDATTAAFYNPAALARTKKTVVEIFNPQVDIGSGVVSASSGYSDYGKHLGLSQVEPLLRRAPGKSSYLGFGLFPNFQMQNFNFGILVKAEGGAYYDNNGNFVYRSKYLVMPSMGLSMSAMGGRFRLGVAVRGIQITENDKSTTTVNGIGYMTSAQEGFGVGLDGGALFSLPWVALPTVGFVARNIGDTSFPGGAPVPVGVGGSTAHEKIKMTYDGSFALFPKFGKSNVFTIAADYRDMLNKNHVDFKRRMNLGFEMSFGKSIFLRAGLGRGYWTAGLGLASKFGSLDMGTYAEELDPSAFRSREDRRVSIRYGLKF